MPEDVQITTGLGVKIEGGAEPPPWIPNAAAAHVTGLTKSLRYLGYTDKEICAAYQDAINKLTE